MADGGHFVKKYAEKACARHYFIRNAPSNFDFCENWLKQILPAAI